MSFPFTPDGNPGGLTAITMQATALAMSLLAGCAVQPVSPVETETGTLSAHGWHCADGSTVISRNLGGDVELRDGALLHRLRQQPAASGARYEGGARQFHTRGNTALLIRDGGAPVSCQEQRRLSLIEDARNRGVRLRATGNEPGWVLEIGPGEGGRLDDQYGTVRRVFEQLSQTAGGLYEGRSGGTRLRIEVRDEPCIDDMSGQTFAVRVHLTVNGETRRGCGEQLR